MLQAFILQPAFIKNFAISVVLLFGSLLLHMTTDCAFSNYFIFTNYFNKCSVICTGCFDCYWLVISTKNCLHYIYINLATLLRNTQPKTQWFRPKWSWTIAFVNPSKRLAETSHIRASLRTQENNNNFYLLFDSQSFK